MEEIEKNDYNLNISRYISTAKPEPVIDLNDVNEKLTEIEKKASGWRAMQVGGKWVEEVPVKKVAAKKATKKPVKKATKKLVAFYSLNIL